MPIKVTIDLQYQIRTRVTAFKWYLPQSGALPRAGQVPGYQHRRGPRDGQPAEQRRGDEGHFHQAHPGGQSRWTERDLEDWRPDRRGKGHISGHRSNKLEVLGT